MRIFDRHSAIFRTGALLLGVPFLFQLGALGYLMHAQSATSRAEQWELHSKEVMRRAAVIAQRLTEAHSALRGNAIFRDPRFELERRDQVRQLPAILGDLRALVSDNPSQQRQVDRISSAARPYAEWFASMERFAAARQWDAFVENILTLDGKKRIDAVEAALAHFNAEEERLDRQRRDEAAAARARESRTLTIVFVLTAVLALALLVVFARGFSARLARISTNGERLATGEPLLAPLEGDDEVARLDRILHQSDARLQAAARAEKRHAAELEARRDALERVNRELEFKTQESEMFVYSVSHDLRSPLVNLQGFTKELVVGCDQLREGLYELDPASPVRQRLLAVVDGEMQEAVGFIQTAVTRLSAIVDALLRLSRAGRVDFRPERVDLDEMAARIVRSLRVSIDEKRAEVRVERLPAVFADRSAIEQVLANLIVNAVNYLDPARPGRIRVAAADTPEKPGFVTLLVEDNGLGIPLRYLSKLFLPFERLHAAHAKGEGIGLALAKRIVERHDGRIWVESREHEGTTFFVSLPAADRAQAA